MKSPANMLDEFTLNLAEEIENLKVNSGKYISVYPGYINHIRFPRYKNISDGTRIDFTFPITALVGSNGSGKTSVLNALYGAPSRKSTGQYWFSTKVDPIEEGEGSPSRFIYGHYNSTLKSIVETRKARVKKHRDGRPDPNYWEPTKESSGDNMEEPKLQPGKAYQGRSKDRWNPVVRDVLYINFRKELSAFDKYFYFGKDPVPSISRANASGSSGKKVSRKIINKMDQVRHDAELLSRVIEAGDTTLSYRNKKLATENRLLNKEELKIVSFVLGRRYDEARWIKHRLFKGDGGLSVVFKTKHGRYSEAFAGSGEVAITSCVVQILNAKRGTLVLLDEPEVSLHPAAQERLLAFLANRARTRQLQIIFSTHSPHFLTALPDNAIKTFHQLDDGRFTAIPSTHPYAAFRRLGAVNGGRIRVIVEDRLASFVVKQALLTLSDKAEREVFYVDYSSGGAEAILTHHIPVLLHAPGHTLVLLDGDKSKIASFVDPDTIPASQNEGLGKMIRDLTGVDPQLNFDGGANGVNKSQQVTLRREYLKWIYKNVDFIPTTCPEELVLRAVGEEVQPAKEASAFKNQLRKMAEEALGSDITNEETDNFGYNMLATRGKNSAELSELGNKLKAYLASTKAKS